MKKITIIGGGASGQVAGIFAAIEGAKVLIIEKNDILGRKVIATGNGRCNYTNSNATFESEFAYEALKKFTVEDTVSFFRRLGVEPRTEDQGRMYPYSEQSIALENALEYKLAELGVEILKDVCLDVKRTSKGKWEVSCEKSGKKLCDAVILATGGKAGPQYGLTGEGYRIAKNLGHGIVKTIPALVALNCHERYFEELSELKGVRAKGKVKLIRCSKELKNIEEVLVKGVTIKEEIGEIQFTKDGLSGICIFNLSNYLKLAANEKYYAVIDLVPELTKEKLKERLIERYENLGNRSEEEFLTGFLNKKIAKVIGKAAKSEKKDQFILKLVEAIKNFSFEITGSKGWKEAQTTVGGVDLEEINVTTMESKKCEELYFAGEIVDVHGPCGGYNLQWAWTSGAIAGKEAAIKKGK